MDQQRIGLCVCVCTVGDSKVLRDTQDVFQREPKEPQDSSISHVVYIRMNSRSEICLLYMGVTIAHSSSWILLSPAASKTLVSTADGLLDLCFISGAIIAVYKVNLGFG